MDKKLENKIKEYETRLKHIEDILFGLKDDRVFRAKIKAVFDETGDTVSGGYVSTPLPSEVTISGGVITVSQTYHTVDTQGDAATDDLDTIDDSNLSNVAILVLRAESSTRSVVLKDGTGNLHLAGDCTLDHSRDTITLIGTGGVWYELARSNNDT